MLNKLYLINLLYFIQYTVFRLLGSHGSLLACVENIKPFLTKRIGRVKLELMKKSI